MGKLFLGSLAVIAILVFGFGWYYTNSQNRIETLLGNNATLETGISINENTIQVLLDREKVKNEQITTINKENSRIRQENRL